MTTFFDRVLPAVGPFALFTGTTGPDGKLTEPRHWNGLQSHEALERKVQELSTQPLNVFYAMGSCGPNRKPPIAKRALFLDLDSKDFGGSIKDALLGLSAFVRATGLPPPSVYVHSGRGVHVYWCLDRDVPVAEWEPVAEALKAKCQELDFAADPSATADPARVLRVPGTLNRKGAEPLPCHVLSDNGTTHSLDSIARQLSMIPSASSTQSKLAALAPADALVTKQSFKPLSASEVEAMLGCIRLPPTNSRDLWVQILCAVQDWGQKSEESWQLFDAWSATQPSYQQSENRKIWNSFTPDGGITIGTLVKLAGENGYEHPDAPKPVAPAGASLAEQILQQPQADSTSSDDEPQVKQVVVSDPLMISAQHAVNAGGKQRFDKNDAVNFLAHEFVVISEQSGVLYSKTKRAPMEKTVIDDLLTRYMPLNASGVPIEPCKLIRRHGVVDSVDSLGFHPAAPAIYRELGKNYVNQYTAPADLIPATPQEIALLKAFWNYMFPVDQIFSRYLLQCYGHIVQNPAVKIESAPLIISPDFGTGKTTLAYEIPRRLVGEQNTQTVSNKTLRGNFSGYLNGKQFLHFDEIHVNGKWDSDDTANSLKNVIAGSMVEVRPLYMNPFNIVNRVFVTATSNFEDAMSLPTDGERRWGVYAHTPPIGSTPAKRAAFFAAFYAWLNSPRGAGVLRWYFAQVDLKGFNPSAPPPLTTAKKIMVDKSQTPEVRAIAEAMNDGDAPFNRDLTSNEKVRQFLHSETGRTYTSHQAREFLRKAVPGTVTLKKVRTSPSTGVYPICLRNKEQWIEAEDAGDLDKIRKELTT